MKQILIAATLIAIALSSTAQVSQDQAVAQAQQRTGGRVLSVDRSDTPSPATWRVKVLTPQGEVRAVVLDGGKQFRAQ